MQLRQLVEEILAQQTLTLDTEIQLNNLLAREDIPKSDFEILGRLMNDLSQGWIRYGESLAA